MRPRPETLLNQLRRLSLDPGSDAALLARFVRDRDEDAFTALVERHFALVRGVCHRVLGDAHAAEDVAQAAFLLLARKAAAIRRPEALLAWLYGTARRLALRCRRAEIRRRRRETRFFISKESRDPLEELSARELLLLIDEEIQQLPEVYRLPILLCCLEGHDQAEAARVLGWTSGSLKGRLERGRARLHARLARRGLTLPAALLALGTARAGAPAGLSKAAAAFAARAPVAEGVSGTVIALARGGLRAMFFSRLKVMLAVAVVGLAATGAGWLATGTGRGGPAATAAAPAARPQPPAAPEERKDDKRTDMIAKLRSELRHAMQEAEEQDHDLTERVIKARQQQVELEEQLRQLEPEPLVNLDAERTRITNRMSKLMADMDKIKQLSKPDNPGATESIARIQKELVQERDRLQKLDGEARAARQMWSKRRLGLRREMVRQEEEVRQLERKRDAVREQAARRHQEAAEGIRRLEGGPALRERELPLRGLTQKLNAIQRELTELRREVQRLRPAPK